MNLDMVKKEMNEVSNQIDKLTKELREAEKIVSTYPDKLGDLKHRFVELLEEEARIKQKERA